MPRTFSVGTETSLYEYEDYAGASATAEGAAAYIQRDRDARWPPPDNPAPIAPDDVNHNWEQRRLQSSPALSGLAPRPATPGPAASGSAARPKVKMCKHKPPQPIDPKTNIACDVTDSELDPTRKGENETIRKAAQKRVARRRYAARGFDANRPKQEYADRIFGVPGANVKDYERLAKRAGRAGIKLDDVPKKRPDMIEMIKSEITMRNWKLE